MYKSFNRATPGIDDTKSQSDWIGKTISGTSLNSQIYYDYEIKKFTENKRGDSIIDNLYLFYEYNEEYYEKNVENPELLFDRSLNLIFLILNYLFTNAIEIPEIRFSAFEDGIDITIKGEYYKFLITVYQDIYALAFRDSLKNSQNKQGDDIISIINTIKNIYSDDIKKLNFQRFIKDLFFSEIQNGWY